MLNVMLKRFNPFKKRKQQQKNEIYSADASARHALCEFLIYLLQLLVALTIIIDMTNSHMHQFNQKMNQIFAKRSVTLLPTVHINFYNISTVQDYWDYLNYNILEVFHGIEYDNTASDMSQLQQHQGLLTGRMFLKHNLMLGPPRLRQRRVTKNSCYITTPFRSYFNDCYGEWSTESDFNEPLYKGTKYYSQDELDDSLAYSGNLGSYDGGGYVQDLTYDAKANYDIFQQLMKDNWIDRGTRVVIFEFNVYNENVYIFGIIKLYAEISPTGTVVPDVKFNTVKQHTYFSMQNYWVFLSVVLMSLLVSYRVVTDIIAIYDFGFIRHIRSLKIIMEYCIFVVFIISLIYNIWHLFYVQKLEKFVKDENHFISLDRLCYYYRLHITLLSIGDGLVTMLLFYYIRFNRIVAQLGATLKDCAGDLAGFILMFIIVVVAYAQLGLVLFGETSEKFHDFSGAVLTMTLMLIRQLAYDEVNTDYPTLAPIFFLSFMLIAFFILMSMCLAVILTTYFRVKSNITGRQSPMFGYLFKTLKRIYYCVRYVGKRPYVDPHAPKVTQFTLDVDEEMDENVHSNNELRREQKRKLNIIQKRLTAMEDIFERLIVNFDDLLHNIERMKHLK